MSVWGADHDDAHQKVHDYFSGSFRGYLLTAANDRLQPNGRI